MSGDRIRRIQWTAVARGQLIEILTVVADLSGEQFGQLAESLALRRIAWQRAKVVVGPRKDLGRTRWAKCIAELNYAGCTVAMHGKETAIAQPDAVARGSCRPDEA